MLIRTELHNETRIRSIYKIDNLNNRESALRWAVNASKVLPFEGLTIHIEDGDSYHDGTISSVVAEIDNIDSFVNKYLKTPIYVVCIRGNYKGAHISVQIH